MPSSDWTPALINTAAALATAALLADAFCRLGIVTQEAQIRRASVLVVVLCIAINCVGLIFAGLEHSLHLLTSIAVVLGLASVLDGRAASRWLIFGIVLLPLWRFEGLPLAGLAILALAAVGQYRAAAVALSAVAVTLGSYVAAMLIMGLPPLPSSVLVKSELARNMTEGLSVHSVS